MPSRPTPMEQTLRALLRELPDDRDGLRRAASGVTDWPALFTAAREHGLGGVVLAGLRRADVPLAKEATHDVERLLFVEEMRQEALKRALRDLLRALAERHVRSVSLKGPLLAARLYDAADVRPSTDLDILVDPASLDAVTLALAPLGYVLEGGARGDFFREHHHHVHFEHRTLPVVELHLEAYRGFGTTLDAAPLLDRAMTCSAGGFEHARVLAPEDEFVYLAVHGASHRFERLSWLYDLKLFCRVHRYLRWDVVAARSKELHVERVVALTLRWLVEWLDADVGQGEETLSISRRRAHAAERFAKQGATHLSNALASLAFNAIVCDPSAIAAFGARYVQMKLIHEARLRAETFFGR